MRIRGKINKNRRQPPSIGEIASRLAAGDVASRPIFVQSSPGIMTLIAGRGSSMSRGLKPSCSLEHHAHVVQTGDEAAAVGFVAAGCTVAEPDDVGAGLAKANGNPPSHPRTRCGSKPLIRMNDDLSHIKDELRMHMMGKRYRQGFAKTEPTGDKAINAVRGAIWEAWEMGLDGGRIYPAVPLLDQLTQRAPEPEEPER